MEASEVEKAYRNELLRVERACLRTGRDPASVRLVAVSKTKPIELLQRVYNAGCRDLGENYAQELLQKTPHLPQDVRWHFIGHLQTNKAKAIAGQAYMIHTVDSLRLAQALKKALPEGKVLKILIQANVGREPQKSGVMPEEVIPLLKEIMALGKELQVEGLMTIPPFSEDPEESRPHFAALRALRDRAREETGLTLPELSMGMTADAEVAIEEGATLVRIGTAIFGAR